MEPVSNFSDGQPVSASTDGISIGLPVPGAEAPRPPEAVLAQDTTNMARMRMNCTLLNPKEESRLEYPPGEPFAEYQGRGLKTASDEALVWVLMARLGRLSMLSQLPAGEHLLLKVEYGAPGDKSLVGIMTETSPSMCLRRVEAGTAEWLSFDTIIGIPWRSDFTPLLTLKLQRASRLFGVKLPMAMSTKTIAMQSCKLPFHYHDPQRIQQEVLLQDPKGTALIGSLELAVDFRQMKVGVLRRGGADLMSAIVMPVEGQLPELQAPAMGSAMPAGSEFVLGQPVDGPFRGVSTGARTVQVIGLRGEEALVQTTTSYPDGVTHSVMHDGAYLCF